MTVTLIVIVIGVLGTLTKGLLKSQQYLEKRGDHPDYSIKIWQNTEMSPGNSKTCAITQTPVKRPSAKAAVKNTKRSK